MHDLILPLAAATGLAAPLLHKLHLSLLLHRMRPRGHVRLEGVLATDRDALVDTLRAARRRWPLWQRLSLAAGALSAIRISVWV